MTQLWRVEPGKVQAPVKVIAKTLFRELSQAGYTPAQIVSLSTELTDMVTLHLRGKTQDGGESPA